MIQRTDEGGYEATIEGHHFVFTKWGTTPSLLALLEITQLCSDGMATGIAAGVEAAADPDNIADMAVASFIAQILRGLSKDPHKTLNLIKKLTADRVLMDGRKVAFETDFAENLPLLIAVVTAAVEVQFGNFSFISELFAKAQAMGMNAQLPQPSTPSPA